MSDEILVIATLRATPGNLDALIEGLGGTLDTARTDPGAISIAPHRDSEANSLVLVERWASRELFDAHMGTPHMAAAPGTIGHLLAGAPEVQFLQPLSI